MSQLFGKMVAIIGGGAILTSLATGSILPIVIAVVALLCILSFMNGLDDQPIKKPAGLA